MSLFICIFCGDEKKNKKSVAAHQAFCKSNPKRSKHNHSLSGSMGNKISQKSRKVNYETRKNIYLKTPSKCQCCGTDLLFDKRSNMFCSHSCRAKIVNKNRKVNYSEFGLQKIKFLSSRPDIVKHRVYRIKCKTCNTFFWAEKKLKCCSIECRNFIYSNTAKNNPKMGGNRNNRAYGWYNSKYAGDVWLESSWEYKVAKSLDDNEIKWIRPKYLRYEDKRYYPDFYLLDYNVYLDPKNSYLQNVDSEKLDKVITENKVDILTLSKEELMWDKIKEKIASVAQRRQHLSCKEA
jgi:hypothetical protein